MEIQFYQTTRGDYPVLEFIKSLPEKDAKKILYRINLFTEFGLKKSNATPTRELDKANNRKKEKELENKHQQTYEL